MNDETYTPPTEGSAQAPESPQAESQAPGFAAGAASYPPAEPGFPGAAGVPPPMRPVAGYPAAMPAVPDVPVPWLAAVLGLIPGVGAMYNGQFGKGLAHLAVFALLVSLADHLNGIFGLFVAGWIFYQAFEAFHTARARRDGLPLPNAFGLNNIGERLGFNSGWTGSGSAPGALHPAQTVYAAPPGNFPQASSATGTNPQPWSEPSRVVYPAPETYPAPVYAAPASAANWAGYVPPSAFASSPSPFSPASGRASDDPLGTSAPNWSSVPYGATYAGAPPPQNAMGTSPMTTPETAGRRFPFGALVLILLGGVFMLSNIAPAWRLSERWIVPLLLAAASLWMFSRRVISAPRGAGSAPRGSYFVCALRIPVLLMVLAIMFTLQALDLLTIGQTWPLLLIVLGILLLLERTVGRASPAVKPEFRVEPVPGDPVRSSGDAGGSGR